MKTDFVSCKWQKIKSVWCGFCFFFLFFPIFAQKTPIKNVYRYKLPNGLELFVMENNIAPLAYIEIAVKAGGIAQTNKNAGLFHLYEHMMFKGNRKFRTASEVQRAINDLGVASWNGSTSIDYVNYYFTVPSDYLEDGLDFWSNAIRNPLLDETEFEKEKKVVLAEITGGLSDPDRMSRSAYFNKLFPQHPWRLDPGGSIETIQNATLSQLREIKEAYYVPNNTALFVGGNVKHKEVYSFVKNIFKSWDKGADPWKAKRELQTPDPLTDTVFMVMPLPKVSVELAQVSVFLRGPDTAVDLNATYAADVLCSLLESPDGKFKKTLLEQETLAILDAEYISSVYATYRESGFFEFKTVMANPETDLAYRVYHFSEVLLGEIFPKITEDQSYFLPEDYSVVKQRIEDSQIYQKESVDEFLGMLRFWWASASSDYYFSYIDTMKKVSFKDIASLTTKYILNKPALVSVLVNPEVYDDIIDELQASGYEVITPENAFWHSK